MLTFQINRHLQQNNNNKKLLNIIIVIFFCILNKTVKTSKSASIYEQHYNKHHCIFIQLMVFIFNEKSNQFAYSLHKNIVITKHQKKVPRYRIL